MECSIVQSHMWVLSNFYFLANLEVHILLFAQASKNLGIFFSSLKHYVLRVGMHLYYVCSIFEFLFNFDSTALQFTKCS